MARTTLDDIRLLIEIDESVSLDKYIGMATRLVDRIAATDTTSLLTAESLADIETCLAGHFYQSARDPAYKSMTMGKTSATFDFRSLWQMAVDLDATGYLANLNGQRAKASAAWGGKVPSEQIDYVDRD